MGLQSIFRVLLLLHGITSAIPVDAPNDLPAYGPANLPKRGLKVLKTTKLSDGTVLDWVEIASQVSNGVIAAAPPAPLAAPALNSSDPVLALLQTEPEKGGPKGTVPIPRVNPALVNIRPIKVAPHPAKAKARAVGDHWYSAIRQNVNNWGGRAYFNVWQTFTQANADFSLLQLAVSRLNVPKPGDNSVLVQQTVEAGWINYPNQIARPHIFTYYTTNGYARDANNEGGWNRDVTGWVQYDTQIFPGTVFSPLSTAGGTQYELQIQYLLYNGNWWLWVKDRWIGYYPASLFGARTVAASSLQTQSTQLTFYGEVYDSHPTLTTTDMGSGQFPSAGYGQAAFIRNIDYTDTANVQQPFTGTIGIVSDVNRYRLETHISSGSTWGSYIYLGGPGAGGVVGG